MIDLDEILGKIIDVTGIRSSEWELIEISTRIPSRNRKINELGNDSYNFTRFNSAELTILYSLLFSDFNEISYVTYNNRFTFKETLIIALHYMAHATSYYELCYVYGGDWTGYSLIINWFARFLFHKFYHRVCGKSLEYWTTVFNIDIMREKIFEYVCYDNNYEWIKGLEHISLDMFWVFGFIDWMMKICCCPGSGPVNNGDRHINDNEIQRAFFTNYGHQWRAKTQGVLLPNGMLVNIYITSITQNDKGVVNIFGLAEELE